MGKERMSLENKVQYEKEPVKAMMVGRRQMVITSLQPFEVLPKAWLLAQQHPHHLGV